MVASFTSVNTFDLNIAHTTQPIVMPSVRLDVPDVHPEVPTIHPDILAMPSDVWHPNFTFNNRPITLYDSVILHDSTTVAIARGFVLPRDQALLIDKFDIVAINDSLVFSIQGAISASDLARRLHVRNEEMEFLRNQAGVLQ
jgi:hypothetical protein